MWKGYRGILTGKEKSNEGNSNSYRWNSPPGGSQRWPRWRGQGVGFCKRFLNSVMYLNYPTVIAYDSGSFVLKRNVNDVAKRSHVNISFRGSS